MTTKKTWVDREKEAGQKYMCAPLRTEAQELIHRPNNGQYRCFEEKPGYKVE